MTPFCQTFIIYICKEYTMRKMILGSLVVGSVIAFTACGGGGGGGVPANGAPSGADINVSVHYPKGSVNITLTGNDPEAKTLTYTVVEQPKYGKLTGEAPNLVYTPDLVENVDMFKSSPSTQKTKGEEPKEKIALMEKQNNGEKYPVMVKPTSKTLLEANAKEQDKTKATDEKSARFYGHEMEGEVPRYDSFTYKVSDGANESAIMTVSITRTRSYQTQCTYTNAENTKTGSFEAKYDAVGNLVERISIDYNIDGTILYTVKDTYSYDADGNQLTENHSTDYVDDTVHTDSSSSTTYTYDAQGNQITMHSTSVYGTSTTISKGTYTYDGNGNRLTQLYENFGSDGTTLTRRQHTTMTYDAKDNMTRSVSEYDNAGDGAYDDQYTYDYTYDERGNTLTIIRNDDLDLDGTPDYRHTTTMTYDANDNMLTFREGVDGDVNNVFESDSMTTFTYDGDGNELTIIQAYDNNGDNTIDSRRTYTMTYDSNGNVLSSIYESDNNADNTIDARATYSYTYNSYGDGLTYLTTFDSNADGTIESSYNSTYTYTNDGYGNILTSTLDQNSDGTIEESSQCTWVEL